MNTKHTPAPHDAQVGELVAKWRRWADRAESSALKAEADGRTIAAQSKHAAAKTLRARAAEAEAARCDLHQHLLDMLGARDHEDAGAIIARLHAAALTAQQPEAEYADADALIAYLDSLHDENDEKWEVAQSAIAGIQAAQQPVGGGSSMNAPTLLEAAQRLTAAFRKLGTSKSLGETLLARVECERTITALDEAIVAALRNDEQAAQVEAVAPIARHEVEQFLVAYHAAVWDMAQGDVPDYEYAGRDLAKTFLARFGEPT